MNPSQEVEANPAGVSTPLSDNLALEVRCGLTTFPKWLPTSLLYDAVGSALFQAITELPEYGLTAAEIRLLEQRALSIAAAVMPCRTLVELGPGDGRKARIVIEAFLRLRSELDYYAMDVSRSAVEKTTRDLAAIPGLRAHGVEGSFVSLQELPPRGHAGPRCVMLLGSTLGNFGPDSRLALLQSLRKCLNTGDWVLLGLDLIKPASLLIAAYDDPIGVTAAFNRNVLVRLNREMGASFKPDCFRHKAVWSSLHSRMEMHLEALESCTVEILAAECVVHFDRGETIHTESSYKFDPASLNGLASDAGFEVAAQWEDASWPYSLVLWKATSFS